MSQATPFDPRAFRGALGSFATGVTIVTTRDAEGHDVGLTANSFNSVSINPPMVLWSLAKSSLSLGAFTHAEFFAVHILAADQEPLSNLFAKRGADKFAGLELERVQGGVPLLAGCAARFLCRAAFRYEGGDHEIIVGEVLTFEHFDRLPLVFQGGRYAMAVQKPQAAAPEPRESDSSFGRSSLGYLLGRAHYQLDSKLIPDMASHEIDAVQHSVLSILGVDDDRSLADIEKLMAWTGRHVTNASIEPLVQRGLLRLQGSGEAARALLTDRGRQLVIQLTAAAKAVEEDAVEQLDHSELQVLKLLLKRVIRKTDPGLPALWKRTASPAA